MLCQFSEKQQQEELGRQGIVYCGDGVSREVKAPPLSVKHDSIAGISNKNPNASTLGVCQQW